MAGVQVMSHAENAHISRPPPEIIDVDSLPDGNGVATSASRRSQPHSRFSPQSSSRASSSRQSQVIYVLDSDEEDGAPRPFSGAPRNRLISPPAPPAHHRSVPPVPAVPGRFANHRHRSRSGQPPPVIIPNNAPFSFEAHMNQRLQSPPPPVLPPRGAPRSHHRPAMGLGGALIAFNRREEEGRARREEHNRQNLPQTVQRFLPLNAMARTVMQYFSSQPAPPPGHVQYVDFNHDFVDWGDDPWDAEWLPEDHRHADVLRLPKRATKQPAWLPSYTHPTTPQPGFSFDFEAKTPSPTVIVVDDDDQMVGSSSSSSTSGDPLSTLVCARCMDPLMIAGQNAADLSDEEARRMRVWSLRCGHMLDGKCIEEIMRPDRVVFVTEDNATRQHQGGPESSAALSTSEQLAVSRRFHGSRKDKEALSSVDPKGKGKAVDRSSDDTQPESAMAEDTSIRSRLRSHGNRSLASVSMGDVSMASVASAVEPERPIRPLPRSRGGARAAAAAASPAKPKGKGRARKPVVEGRHEWFCPVSGCCKEHGSVRMRDEEEWKMDDTVGAIALFV
ncbi:hypothetical protein BC835DRAFT_1410503 [Cytidiella melzeri]|nr:hypothetical protein BC835DRAFT_1410503 [Cytidiella melzeri]